MSNVVRRLRSTVAQEGVRGLSGAVFRRTLLEPYIYLKNQEFLPHQKQIWVHIGAHKTGSTSIQDLLRESRVELRRSSIGYDRHGYHLSLKLMRESPLSDEARRELAALWHKRVQSRSEKIVILSGESFSGDMYRGYSNASHVARDLRAVLSGFSVEIIAVVRRQDRWLESVYQQFIKGGRNATFSDFVTNRGPFPVYWDQWLKEYADQFGREHVHAHLYETLFDKDQHVFDVLFARLGTRVPCSTGFSPRRNPGISQVGLEILRRCNDLLTPSESKALRRWVEANFHSTSSSTYSYLSEESREALLRTCHDANLRMFLQYFRDRDPALYLASTATAASTSSQVTQNRS